MSALDCHRLMERCRSFWSELAVQELTPRRQREVTSAEMVHPPLKTENRQLACGDLIDALEECHARGMISKLTGACNDQKIHLARCLRAERLDRTARNKESAKERNRKKKEAFERYDQELAEEKARVSAESSSGRSA